MSETNKYPLPNGCRDEIDQWLWDEMQLLPGCCSSIECLKYDIAREVAEKLWNVKNDGKELLHVLNKGVEMGKRETTEKALAFLNNKFYFDNLFYGVVSTDFNSMEEMFEDFKNVIKEE